MREIGSSVRFLRDKFVPLYSERGYSDKDIRNKEVLALFSCGFVPFLSRQNFVSWCKILQVADLKRLVRMIKGRISLTTSNHQEEYGIDLLKKSAAGQSSVSKKDTQQ